MAVVEEVVTDGRTAAGVFVAPGRPGSLVDVKPRYENFIGGRWVPPVEGEYMQNVTPVDGPRLHRGGEIDRGGRRTGARRRARRQGRLG